MGLSQKQHTLNEAKSAQQDACRKELSYLNCNQGMGQV